MTPRSLADTGNRSTAESELTKCVRKTALGELDEHNDETTGNDSEMTHIHSNRRREWK